MIPDQPINSRASSLFDLQVNPSKKDSYLEYAKCNQGSPCLSLCLSQHCETDAALCGDQECKCRQSHDNRKICCRGPLLKIVSMIEKKRQSFPQVLEWINTKYDQLVDWISDEKARLCSQMNNLGLNEDQMSFLKTVYNGDCNKLTGKQMHKVINDVNLEFKKLQQTTEQIQGRLQKQWENCVEKIKKQVFSINRLITDVCLDQAVVKEYVQNLKSSKVLSTETERVTMTQILEDDSSNRKVSKIQLLYRASDNNFDTDKFWEKCNHKADTVTVMRTNFNKVIGGYTPLSWKKENSISYEQDSSLKSFVFSVTEKTKFTLKQSLKHHAICHSSTTGPQFGSNGDFWISNKANDNNYNLYTTIGNTYENSRVKYDTKEALQFFSGSINNYNFKALDWQVWQVIFQ